MTIGIQTFTPSGNENVVASGDDLRRTLIAHRRELTDEIQSKIRAVRADACDKSRPATDLTELTEVEPEDDLAFVIIQIKSQALRNIDEAVRRLDQGAYGSCVDCGDQITRLRLRALPFAVRCRECEEQSERRSRYVTQ